MNQQSTNIPIYQNDEFDYAEVVWIYVELRTTKNINRIIGSIHKSIPNPVVLVIGYLESQVLLSTSHKRLNKNDKTKVIAEQTNITDWFKPKEADIAYSNLLSSLVVSNLSFENFHSLYEDIHQWIRCEEVIQLVGSIPTSTDKREEAINILNNVQKYQKK